MWARFGCSEFGLKPTDDSDETLIFEVPTSMHRFCTAVDSHSECLTSLAVETERQDETAALLWGHPSGSRRWWPVIVSAVDTRVVGVD